MQKAAPCGKMLRGTHLRFLAALPRNTIGGTSYDPTETMVTRPLRERWQNTHRQTLKQLVCALPADDPEGSELAQVKSGPCRGGRDTKGVEVGFSFRRCGSLMPGPSRYPARACGPCFCVYTWCRLVVRLQWSCSRLATGGG